MLSIVAALKTIEILKKKKAIEEIWINGEILKFGYNDICKELNIDSKCVGFPNRTMFMFPTGDHKSLFWQECIKRGVLFGYAQFINFSHKPEDIIYTLGVCKQALQVVKKNWDNPLKALKGKKADEVFRLVVTKENNVK